VSDPEIQLDYFYDPFCGWCYASAPALKALAEVFPGALTMRPSGLFAGSGARPMAAMAEHSWRNSTRITELTGQIYTDQYRERILNNPHGRLDSTLATRAIVALGEIDSRLEPLLLEALQTARYVDAKDTADGAVVAGVAVKVAAERGYSVNEEAFHDTLVKDEALSTRTSARVRNTLSTMRELSGSGVPRLLGTIGNYREVIDGADLYGGAVAVLKAIRVARDHASILKDLVSAPGSSAR
jgi:putative protein-disulfide isomerase